MSRFLHPSPEVMLWLKANGAKIDDIYRIVVKRNPEGGGTLTFWQYARNKEGKLYVENPEKMMGTRRPARIPPISIDVAKIPDFITLDLYGEPLDIYGDDNEPIPKPKEFWAG